MVCSECGKEIVGEEIYYCPKCGQTLCPECNDVNDGVCPSCNKASLQMYNWNAKPQDNN